MTVRGVDGKKLGKVTSCEEENFTIERGVIFPRDYIARYEDICAIRDGEIILGCGKRELKPGPPPEDWIEGESPGHTIFLETDPPKTG